MTRSDCGAVQLKARRAPSTLALGIAWLILLGASLAGSSAIGQEAPPSEEPSGQEPLSGLDSLGRRETPAGQDLLLPEGPVFSPTPVFPQVPVSPPEPTFPELLTPEPPTAGRPPPGERPAERGWKIAPSISGYGSFTSNARLDPIGHGRSDFFTTITPAVSISADTSRLKLNLDYSLDAIAYARSSDLDQLRNHLALVSTTTLAPELLFVDARAAVAQLPEFSNAPISGSPLAASPNLETVASYIVSPYLRHRFGSFADSELRYTFSQFFSSGQSSGQFSSSGVPDSLTNGLGAALVSGSQFTRFLWTVRASSSDTSYGSSGTVAARDTSDRLLVADTEYRVSDALGLLASLGYERISDPTLLDQPDGPIGSVGLHWTPGPRTSLTLNLNHRFDENFVSGKASYLFSPRTSIAASYSEELATSQSLFASDLSYLTVDEFGNFIDSRTAQIFGLIDSNFGLQNAAFHLKRFDVGLNGVRGRNSFGAIAYDETRQVDFAGQSDHAFGGAVNWGRLLTPVATLNLTLRYRNEKFDFSSSTEQDQAIGAGASLVYHLNETLDGVAAFDFTRQFSDVPRNEFAESVISLGLQKRF
jgi:uncharacterized protein (PEP-CTERM system associated)